MRKLRIGLVTYALHAGGMERLLLHLGKYLVQQGHDVDLVTTIERGEWFETANDYGLPVSHIDGYRKAGRIHDSLHSLRVGAWLKSREYDAIFLNHVLHAQVSIGMLSDRSIVVPIVHSDVDYIYQIACLNPTAWNCVVAVSQKIYDTLLLTIPEHRVKLILNGVDLPSENALNSRSPLGTPVRLVFLGRIHHHAKGVFFLPDIVSEIQKLGLEVELSIIGSGPDEAELEQRFCERNLQDKVTFLGLVPPNEVYSLLLSSHIAVMPSFYEGLPLSLLEAMACGCVPVASRLHKITDSVITDGTNGRLAEVGDVSAFVDAIVAIASQPDTWNEMSKSAHQTVSQHFSTARMGEAYIELIERGIAGAYPTKFSRRWQPPLSPVLIRRNRIVW